MPTITVSEKELSALTQALEDVEHKTLRAALAKLQKAERGYTSKRHRLKAKITQAIVARIHKDFPKLDDYLTRGDTDGHPQFMIEQIAEAVMEAIE